MTKTSQIPEFGPLSGIRVVVAGVSIAGPFAGSLMADFGADFIQIENVGNPDVTRIATNGCGFEQDRRNARAMALDLSAKEGQDVLVKLMETTDILIENNRAGLFGKWGLTDEVLWAANPALVIVHVSGYGQTGLPEYIYRGSWDGIGQAFGNVTALNGTEDGPTNTNPYYSDMWTAMYAGWGALAALRRAEKTGKGESIDIAQFEVMLRGQHDGPMNYFKNGVLPKRTGMDHPVSSAFRPFKAKDGWVFVGLSGFGPMRAGLPFFGLEYGSEMFPSTIPCAPQGTEGARVLEAKIADYCAERTIEEVDTELNAAGIPAAPLMTFDQAEHNPQYIAREVFTEWETRKGETVKGVNIMPKMKNAPGKIWKGAPGYGEDNEDILEELGYTGEQIEAMYESKVLARNAKL